MILNRNNQGKFDRWCNTAMFALLFFMVSFASSEAQMSSSTYKIQSDSINIGGQQSSSASYNGIDTLGEIGTGDSSSTNYKVSAGFLGQQTIYMSISAVSDIAMNPSIGGVSGGTGNGSMSWNVITDNPGGYSLSVKANTTPALRSDGGSFADYTPFDSNPDYTWGVNSADSEFGFSPEGTDIIQKYKDNGSVCNVGSLDTIGRCWDFFTTVSKMIAQSASGNHPSGNTTAVKVQAESGANHIQPNGTYSATIEVTALPL
ncbi:MAG: hypothetical protein M3Q64_00405 [bacterium]|nr:hypothetical protein [bacterium]